MKYEKFEIVGLDGTENGRSYEKHECCGLHVYVGDTLVLRKTAVNVNGIAQEAMKLLSIKNNAETCTVFCVPKAMLRGRGILLPYTGKRAKVIELYSESENSFYSRK